MASTSKISNTNVAATGGSAVSATPNPNIQEFNIRVPKKQSKKYHVMRFNANLNVDFSQWRGVKMERENNMKEFRGMDEDMPKFGGGSEYNRDIREEVRRKKYGIVAKKYRPEAQPWILKLGGKNGKKFKGIREGGVSENAAFYVFTHAPDGNIEAYPLHEWYNFQPIQRYKTLSAEEAEHEFGRRKKVMNYFSLMLRKRLKGDEEEEQDPEDIKIKGGSKKGKELKISEMEEWINSDDDSDSEEDDDDGDKKKKKQDDSDDDGKSSKKGKKAADMKKKKKKKNASDSEAFEESDDGDDEGREMDYDTESSDEEADKDKELKSVAEEDALRKLLTSDEDDEDEEKKSDESGNEDDEKKKKKKDKNKDDVKDKKKKNSKSQDDMKISSSDFSSDSSDSEDDVDAATTSNNNNKNNNNTKNMKVFSTNSSRSGTPTSFMQSDMAAKRKLTNMPSDLTASENSNSPNNTPAKRTKIDSVPSTFSGAVNHNKEDGITEEAVRRYLLRKPMTATELLTKFKSKKVNCTSERLVDTMTQILKKINPIKQTIQGKLYLSLKHTQTN